MRLGSARASSVASGEAMATFLGTISPNTMCRNTTMDSPMTKATAWLALSGRTRPVSPSKRWTISGSAT